MSTQNHTPEGEAVAEKDTVKMLIEVDMDTHLAIRLRAATDRIPLKEAAQLMLAEVARQQKATSASAA